MTLAFLFTGQGAQVVGMGADLIAACADCRNTLEIADTVLGFPLSRLMTQGPEAELTRTDVAQPAVTALSVAHARHLIERGLRPSALAGHSLGQYAALVVAGALSYEDALRLLAFRGKLLQTIIPAGAGAMTAIVGLSRRAVCDICTSVSASDGIVDVACHNAPQQSVISGETAAVALAAARCEHDGARILVLPVSAPFHSRMLEPLVAPFAARLADVDIVAPALPVYDNVSAKPLRDATSVRAALAAQITAPVLFEDNLLTMAGAGITRYVQCGPGKNLLTFAKRTTTGESWKTFDEANAPLPCAGGALVTDRL